MEKQIETAQPDERKTYVKPVILHELGLEARGCPVSGKTIIDQLDSQEQ
jgi:hypothetical protein